MRSIELFTGAGGLALGTHFAGFKHAALVEWNADACRTLQRNAGARDLGGLDEWKVLHQDVRTVDFTSFGPVELVAGGAPCQPFSLGGKHRGMDDPRNMFPEFVRAVRELAPKAFMLENVKGLLRHNFKEYFEYILMQLRVPTIPQRKNDTWKEHLAHLRRHILRNSNGLRYEVKFRLLNAADYGVPQTRERVIVVGLRSDVAAGWRFPEPTHSFQSLVREQCVTGAYWKRHGVRPPRGYHLVPNPAYADVLRNEPLLALKPWRSVRDAISDLPPPREDGESGKVLNHRLNPGARSYPGHTGSPLDLPSKTLKAGVHGVPGGENTLVLDDGSIRYVTVREAARIQTFPDEWVFEGAWSEAMRQLGNAVPVELARVVAQSVATHLAVGEMARAAI